jgi:hypothetical protein
MRAAPDAASAAFRVIARENSQRADICLSPLTATKVPYSRETE